MAIMEERTNEKVLKILQGGYDLHVHSSPDIVVRSSDDWELAHGLDQFRMAGAVIKAHNGSTAGRGWLVNKYAGCQAKLYDSLVMCHAVGGLNPRALEVASQTGGGIKVVWMPTFDSAQHQTFNPPEKRGPGLYILNEYDELKPEVYEILEQIRAKNLILSTGHVSVKEAMILCKEAMKMGVKTVLCHPEFSRTKVPLDTQIELAKMGVVIEKIAINVRDLHEDGSGGEFNYRVTMMEMADRIRRIGSKHCFLASDASVPNFHNSPLAMYHMVAGLEKHGFTEEELKIMVCHNAAALLA